MGARLRRARTCTPSFVELLLLPSADILAMSIDSFVVRNQVSTMFCGENAILLAGRADVRERKGIKQEIKDFRMRVWTREHSCLSFPV